MIWILFWIWILSLLPCIAWSYNIALHAQVFPDGEKVVGSVITTDGLRAAFLKRKEVEKCEIFYPGHYHDYDHTIWDFLIIEGWFLNIHEFIQISRNLFPNIKIFFYCLDPVYPGMNQVIKFNVDGIVTNSLPLRNNLRAIGINSEFIMLAADPDVMKPNATIPRTYGATYVGAGGHMLSQKPELRDMLLEAIPYGLRLHGIGWGSVETFKDIHLGPLPRFELANAYSSAQLVLTSVIKSQDDIHMINNRVFEALSCGAIVIAQYSQALSEVFGDIIQFKTNNTTFRELYRRLLVETPLNELEKMRMRAREVILNHHTWDHRAVQFLSFMTKIKHSSTAKAHNPLKMLWIESKESFQSFDYQFLKNSFLFSFLSKRFSIKLIDENTFREELSTCLTFSFECISEKLYDYHIIFVIIEPYSDLDNLIAHLPVSLLVSDKSQMQRRMSYIIGIDPTRFNRCYGGSLLTDNSCHNFLHYDVLLFRDYYEMDVMKWASQGLLPQSRLQHLFGIPSSEVIAKPLNLSLPLIVCSVQQGRLCNRQMRENILKQYNLNAEDQLLVLTGGDLEEWMMIHESIIERNDWGNIVHVQGDQISKDFMFLIRNYSSMIIIIQDISYAESGIPYTLSDFILPMVLGAFFNKSLHLSHMNEHLIGVSTQGCEEWGLSYLINSTNSALNRLLGFPPRSASINLRSLDLSTENHCRNCSDEDIQLLKSCDVMIERKRPFTIVAIDPINFEIGRDGKLCLNVVNGTEDLQLCLLRRIDYLIIEQNFTMPQISSANLTFKIRGGLFSDVSYESTYSFALHRPWLSYKEELFSPIPRNRSIDRVLNCRFHLYQLSDF